MNAINFTHTRYPDDITAKSPVSTRCIHLVYMRQHAQSSMPVKTCLGEAIFENGRSPKAGKAPADVGWGLTASNGIQAIQ
jgi:hypothetical protein